MSATHEAVTTGETYKEKFLRKFKEQPLVPIGAAATTIALIVAMTKMRRGDSQSFNNWLRVRVIAQGATIVAIVGGSYAYGQTKSQKDAQQAQAEQERILVAARERREFEERLRGAEEAHEAEQRAMQGRGTVWGWGWGKKDGEAASSGARTSSSPPPLAPSAGPEQSQSASPGRGWSWFGWGRSSGSSSSSPSAEKKS